MNRDCNKCIHHISGKCDAWECDMKTLKDYRNVIIDEFAERIKELFKYESAWGETLCHQRFVVDISKINEIVEQLKGSVRNN